MALHPSLEDALAGHPSCSRVQGLLFTRLLYTPSGEHVSIGFRCFRGEDSALLRAFEANHPDAIATLEPALRPDGEPATSLVRLDLAHVPSGGIVGLQPVRYVDYQAVPAAAARILEGEAAAAWAAAVFALDQNRPR